MIEVEILIDAEGILVTWWTPELAPVICALCGRCPGWESPERPVDCHNANPWCG